MDLAEAIRANLTSPVILFFVLGLIGAAGIFSVKRATIPSGL